MGRKNKIWVCVYGGVIGFEPYEIAELEAEYRKVKPHMDQENLDECKWAFFNEYFEDVLGFRTAHGYSALWRDEESWEECENVLYDLCRQKK